MWDYLNDDTVDVRNGIWKQRNRYLVHSKFVKNNYIITSA